MPRIGKYEAKKTGIVAEIGHILLNGDPTYLCKINGTVYRMTPEEFASKWKPYSPPKTRGGKQEGLF